MPTFSYKALQANGKMAEGVLEAGSRPDAMRQMETLGLRPVDNLRREPTRALGRLAAAVVAEGDRGPGWEFQLEATKGRALRLAGRLFQRGSGIQTETALARMNFSRPGEQFLTQYRFRFHD